MPVDWCKEGWLLTAGRALQAEGGKGGMGAESGEIYMYSNFAHGKHPVCLDKSA